VPEAIDFTDETPEARYDRLAKKFSNPEFLAKLRDKSDHFAWPEPKPEEMVDDRVYDGGESKNYVLANGNKLQSGSNGTSSYQGLSTDEGKAIAYRWSDEGKLRHYTLREPYSEKLADKMMEGDSVVHNVSIGDDNEVSLITSSIGQTTIWQVFEGGKLTVRRVYLRRDDGSVDNYEF